jgi:hypothetical protein
MTTSAENLPAKIDFPAEFGTIKTNDKEDKDFRIYDDATTEPRVVQHYKDMRSFHTVAFYNKMEHKYSFENGAYRRLMTIEEAFDELEHYIVRMKPANADRCLLNIDPTMILSQFVDCGYVSFFLGRFRPRSGFA